MSEAKPYSPEERAALKSWGLAVRAFYEEEGHPFLGAADATVRWDATLCQAEAALDAVTQERDAYGWIVRELLDDDSPPACFRRLRSRRMTDRQIERVGDALLALPEVTP